MLFVPLALGLPEWWLNLSKAGAFLVKYLIVCGNFNVLSLSLSIKMNPLSSHVSQSGRPRRRGRARAMRSDRVRIQTDRSGPPATPRMRTLRVRGTRARTCERYDLAIVRRTRRERAP